MSFSFLVLKELKYFINQVVYNDNNECYVEIVAYGGKSMEEHKYISASKNRENFKKFRS